MHNPPDQADGTVTFDWHAIWLFAAISSALMLIAFLVTFSDEEPVEAQSPASQALQGASL